MRVLLVLSELIPSALMLLCACLTFFEKEPMKKVLLAIAVCICAPASFAIFYKMAIMSGKTMPEYAYTPFAIHLAFFAVGVLQLIYVAVKHQQKKINPKRGQATLEPKF